MLHYLVLLLLFFSLDPDSLFLYKFTMPASVIADPFAMVLITGSVYTTVILSLDRCLAVLRPLHWSRIFTRRRIKVALFLTFIFAVVVDSPVYFQAKLHTTYFPKFNTSFLAGKPTDYYFSWFHQEVYMTYFMPICQIIIPLILIVSSNAAIVTKVLLHKQKSEVLRSHVPAVSAHVPTSTSARATSTNVGVSRCISKLPRSQSIGLAHETSDSDRQGHDTPKHCQSSYSSKNDFESATFSSACESSPATCSTTPEDPSKPDNITISSGTLISADTNISNTNCDTTKAKSIHTSTGSHNQNTSKTTKTSRAFKVTKVTRSSSRVRARATHGVDVSRLTAQVVAISLITLTSRALAAANFYVVTEEGVYYIKYCSRACAWTGALNLLFIKINASVNFVFYCFFGGKFRTVFKATFRCLWCRCRRREICCYRQGGANSKSDTKTGLYSAQNTGNRSGIARRY